MSYFSDPMHGTARPVASQKWHSILATPVIEVVICKEHGATIRQFSGTPREMLQPALSDNVVALHLGGSKRVRRCQSNHREDWIVETGSFTLMPALQSNCWTTEGPIGYAHLTLSVGLLAQFAREEMDRDPYELSLLDQVGQTDPLISQLFQALLDDTHFTTSCGLFRESLFAALVIRLLRTKSTLTSTGDGSGDGKFQGRFAQGGLAGWQLRRVVDYMAEHLSEDVAMADLTALTGLSRAQFFRAFRQSTSQTPHRYLTVLRVEQAKQLLKNGDMSEANVAAAVGFQKLRHFSTVFRRQAGVSPRLYRYSL